MKRPEQIQTWVDQLSPEQMRPLLAELIDFACDAEHVRFGDLAPYWEATGDPLVDGQQTFAD